MPKPKKKTPPPKKKIKIPAAKAKTPLPVRNEDPEKLDNAAVALGDMETPQEIAARKAMERERNVESTPAVIDEMTAATERGHNQAGQAPPEQEKIAASADAKEDKVMEDGQITVNKSVDAKALGSRDQEQKKAEPVYQETPVPPAFRNSGFYFNRAVFFQQSGEWQKALENYRQAAEMAPGNANIYNNMGVIYKELGQYDQAIDEFLRALYLDPKYGKVYNNIGVVYYLKENYAGAATNYQKAIQIDSENLDALNNLAVVYKAQGQYANARAALNRALAINPKHPSTNYNLAVLYEAEKNIEPARHYYWRFVELGEAAHPSLVFEVRRHLDTLR